MVALIIGVSSTLGENLAKNLLSKGYQVIGTYLNNYPKVKGDNLSLYKCDLTKEKDIISLKENITSLYVIINCAAFYQDEEIDIKTKETFMKVFEVNVCGTFLICKHLSEFLKNGIIFNLASTDGIYSQNEYNYDYAASKAAIISLTKSLGMIMKPVRVYSISPNWIDTKTTRMIEKEYLLKELKRTSQSRLITPSEISDIILNTISSKVPSGTNIIIDVHNNKLCVKYER